MPNPFRRRRRPRATPSSTSLSAPSVRRGFTATRLPKDFLEMTDRQQKAFIRELLTGMSPGPITDNPRSATSHGGRTRQRRRNH